MINKLLDLLKPKRKILIQTHNNPDPDAIAAAFGLKNIITRLQKKRVTIAYMGIIGRIENRKLVKICNIDMYRLDSLNISRYDCIIVVDTQIGAGNSYQIGDKIPDAVIDHHNRIMLDKSIPFIDIRTEYGATSTIITEYYKQLGLIPSQNTAIALYYGIKTDIFGVARKSIQKDVDMLGFIFPSISISKLNKIETPDMPNFYFRNIGKAIDRSVIIGDLLFCDLGTVRNPDLIAEMSDFLLRMRKITTAFIVGKIKDTCYFSLRYKKNDIKVGVMAISLVKDIGYGGGHMKSAGGQVPLTDKLTYKEAVKILKKRLIEKIKNVDPEHYEEKHI